MPVYFPSNPNNLIAWNFQIADQGFITRYGVAGPNYYKQFLPGGLVVPELHPPKRIDPRLYQRAKDLFDRSRPSKV